MTIALNQNIRVYANATGRDVHINAPLTNMTVGYRPTGLIADKIYAPLRVDKQNGNYYVWTKADWFRIPNAERSRGAPAKRIGFSVSSQTYFCREYALAMEVPIEDVSNADPVLDFQGLVSHSNFIMDELALAWEDRLAVTLTTTTNMGSSTSLTNRWSDPIAGSPIDDLSTGFESIRLLTGKDPNKAIFSGIAWNNFKKHPDVIAYVRGVGDTRGGGPVKEADVAAAFGLEEVLIGRGVKNTADEGIAGVYTDIWSSACILLHVARVPGKMVPSHGYTFQWVPEGRSGPMAVQRDSDNKAGGKHVEVVEVSHYQDERVTGTDLGYLIVNC